MTPAAALPDEAASLFRESPEAFIAARDALASRLREDGRGDDAATVKALRKPTVVAWALNQLSDRDPDGVRALVDAGAEVRAAQQAALSSKRGAAERSASAGAARREAVSALSSSALDALAGGGPGLLRPRRCDRRRPRGVLVDPDAGEALSAGTMERPPAAVPGSATSSGSRRRGRRGTRRAGPETEAGASRADGEARGSWRRVPAAERAELRAEVARLRRDRDAAAAGTGELATPRTGSRTSSTACAGAWRSSNVKHADAEAASEGELEAKRAERALAKANERLERGGGSTD